MYLVLQSLFLEVLKNKNLKTIKDRKSLLTTKTKYWVKISQY